MRVIISAGGTGGHIYPAISIINKIKEKEPNSEILYIGTDDRMEKDIIPPLGINYVALKIKGFKRKICLENFKNLNLIRKSIKRSKQIIKDFDPEVVIGVGGYVTFPVIYAAHSLKVPVFIHEQNSTPGLTNKIVSKIATKIGVSFLESMKYFDEKKVVYTGNPCGEEALKLQKANKEKMGLNKDKKLILMVMGSLGSSKINKVALEIFPKLKYKDYEFLFVSGNNYYEDFKQLKLPNNVFILPYIDNMTKVLKITDLFISRAGATTLSEIIALQIPTILIPSPYVTNNHQYKNAIELVNREQAFLLEEKNLTANSLIKMIDEIISNEKNLKNIKNNLKKQGVLKSSTLIYKILNEIKK